MVSSIADRMNVSKADILNPESENAAVKLALAETHVIQETKTFLEQHGVDLSSLDAEPGQRRPPRSDRIILVKNIPYGTSAADVRALFEPHGELRRVLVPPAGTLAVVEFVHPDEGRKAFRAVAYRRMGNSIVYLEKGPEGMFITDEPIADPSPGDTASSPTVTASGVTPIVAPEPAVPSATAAAAADEPALSAGTTLFVKNLAFSTTTEKLSQVTRHLPEFAFARVQTRVDPARPGTAAKLSMGYGFVGFRTPDGARRGLKSLDGLVLDGHKLAVKFAGRGAEEDERGAKDGEGAAAAKARTTKMIVKNVPFEATKKDIRELFGCVSLLSFFYLCLPRSADDCVAAGPTRNSSPSACHGSSTTARVGLRSSSSRRATKRSAPTRPFATPISSVATSCSSGQKRARRMSKSCGRRRVSVTAEVPRCRGGNGSWSWATGRTGARTRCEACEAAVRCPASFMCAPPPGLRAIERDEQRAFRTRKRTPVIHFAVRAPRP